MIEAERKLIVDAAPETVFAYLADFTTTEEWDPSTIATKKVSGEGGIGTVYLNTSKFAGRTSDITYEVVSLTEGESIELRGQNKFLVARDTITVRPYRSGTWVSYRVRFAFQGWLRLLEPLLQFAVTHLLDSGARGLRRALGQI